MAALRHTYDAYTDERLMELVTAKDQRAFESIYDRYSRPILNYFHKMLWRDKEKARDFTQELFTKLIHKPHLYDPSRPFKTWFYSVAHNMCKNEYAKHEVRRTVHNDLKKDEAVGIPDGGRSIDRSSFQQKLQEALNGLDEVKRQTFELRFRQELSVLEISEIMTCSEGTVKSRLFYTLKDLNQKLKVFEGILLWLPILTYLNL